jgi:hypothetical protein
MLAQVLNREFLLSVVADTRWGLERALADRKRRGPPSALDDFTEEQLREVVDALAAVADAPEGLEPAEEVSEEPRDDAAPPKDDYAYVPRSPLAGIVQSVIEEQVELRAPPDAVVKRRFYEDRRGPGPSPVTDEQLAAVPLRRTDAGRRVWGRYEVARPQILSDPGWILSAVVIAWNKLKHPAPFNRAHAGPIPIGDPARIIVVGDWGSGLARAWDVRERIVDWLRRGAAERRDLHVIHLGDVYYTGGQNEYANNFLDPWPVTLGEDIGSFTLNGNHDMYQGAHHYFDTALADPRFARQANSSTFSLRNDRWQLIGLDTAYEDAGLYGDQANWARELVENGEGRRTALLTHHQPWSVYAPGASLLRHKIEPVLATNEVDAWFWGHEHRCLVYRGAENLPFASCVGHGGIPEYTAAAVDAAYTQPLVYDYRQPYGDGWQPWIRFGFVAADLDGNRMHLTYVDEFGCEHHTEDV